MEAMDLYELVKQDENELEIFLEDHPDLFTRIDKVIEIYKNFPTSNPVCTPQNQRSLLHWTVLTGRDKLFEYLGLQLMKRGGLDEFINLEDDTKATPLILAVLGGNIEICKHLLNHGASINHKNYQGHSALQYACSKGKKDIVELLLERNADANMHDHRGDTCLHRLASVGREEILGLLLKRPELTVLNAQNSEGNTAL